MVVLNTKMTSSKVFIKSNAQKEMTNSSFGRKFHDLQHFVLDLFFISLKFIINSRESYEIINLFSNYLI